MNLTAHVAGRNDLDAHSLGLDEFERGLLAVSRYFFLCRAEPDRQAWQVAFSVAVERWGPDIGLPVAFAASKLVRALADLRPDFDSLDPFETEARTRVSSDEAMMMRMLHHMRRDQTSDARDAVDALTRGWMDPHVIRAGLALASRFAAGVSERRRPALRLVR
ncbi:hypothetical protein GCM10007385_00080 [Tateyamaria omphalii]|uniref:hypothetical protein n=1 Tax=Tateyamaria omphalii TaxID=299262 RepID=UPI001674E431|nr:hypothetical protein [Tateyamaria omphalii]GGX37527.1 hypothetical protein GCM10007385_00080 [Tateyamaria omphalii]